MRILIIDDEPFLLALYRRVLRQHEVTAVGPEQALPLIEAIDRFDVILCDFNLPDQNGQSFFDFLCSKGHNVAERVILCTGGGVDEEGWLQIRAHHHVVYKPFSTQALKDKVAAFQLQSAVPERSCRLPSVRAKASCEEQHRRRSV